MTHSNAAITDTASTVLAAQGQRDFLLIQNIGANEVWITLDGTTPVADQDIMLAASGNGILLLDYIVPTEAIKAVCSSGETSTLSIVYHVGEY